MQYFEFVPIHVFNVVSLTYVKLGIEAEHGVSVGDHGDLTLANETWTFLVLENLLSMNLSPLISTKSFALSSDVLRCLILIPVISYAWLEV